MAEKSKEERKRQYQKQIADMHRQILDLDPSRNSGVPLLKLVSKHAQSGNPMTVGRHVADVPFLTGCAGVGD